MKQFISMLVAAVFAAASVTAIAQDKKDTKKSSGKKSSGKKSEGKKAEPK